MERKAYLDYLRLAATFAIVVLHVSSSNWHSADVNGIDWKIFNCFDSLVRWGVPVFVMISGSLFLNRDITIRVLYRKYILRMLTAFVIWGLFYAVMTEETVEKGIVYGISTHIGTVISGHYHMWFIPMIVGIYMCIPFIKRIIADSFSMKYYMLLSFIFAFMIPWIIQLLNDFVLGNNEYLTQAIDAFNLSIYNLNMHMVLGYIFYFVLGYYLDGVELKKNQRMIIYICGVIGFLFTAWVDLYLTLKTQQPCQNYYGFFNVNVLLETICIHTWFKYHNYRNKRLNSWIIHISGYTFGVYLVHTFFIEKFSSVLHFDTLSFNAVISVPVISLVVFICALLVSVLLNHIPIIKKYCV